VWFALSEDQALFSEAIRQVLERHCPPQRVRAAWDHDTPRDCDLWHQLVQSGVVGLVAPENLGGLGLSEVDLAPLMEEAGRVALPEPLLENAAVALPLLNDVGGCEAWIEAVVSGEKILSVGLTNQRFVTDAHLADALILERDGQLTLMPTTAVSLSARRSIDHCRRLFSVDWDGNGGTVLATGEKAQQLSDRAFDRGALMSAAMLVGIGQKLIEMAVDYASVRHQFGQPIGSFQAIKHRLADSLIKVRYARPLVWRAACALRQHDEQSGLYVSMAKSKASVAADFAARSALQVYGAIGYTLECDLHLWMKRAWSLAEAWGSAEWHQDRVGQTILHTSTHQSQEGIHG